jgi:hypothetical protein
MLTNEIGDKLFQCLRVCPKLSAASSGDTDKHKVLVGGVEQFAVTSALSAATGPDA